MKAKFLSFSLILFLCFGAFFCLTGCKSDGKVTVSSKTWYFTEGAAISDAEDENGTAITFDVTYDKYKSDTNTYEETSLTGQKIEDLEAEGVAFTAPGFSSELDLNGDGDITSKDGTLTLDASGTVTSIKRIMYVTVNGETFEITYIITKA